MVDKKSLYRVKKGIAYLKHYGWKEFWIRLKERMQNSDADYAMWYQCHEASEDTLKLQCETVFAYSPLISIVVPVYNTPKIYLEQMLQSVCNQSYGNWELCIANANPLNREVQEVLSAFTQMDKRIRVVDVARNQGIAQNTNAALAISTGEYVGFLDHDDLLAADALFEIVSKLNLDQTLDLLYTDEDKITEDVSKHFQPHFKPEFNLDLIRANNYICHFCVIRNSLIQKVGGLREEFNGAQDYDLILRCIEKTKRVARVPRILYHWRVHNASTSDNPMSKMYAYEAGKIAIEEHLKRCGEDSEVSCKKDLGFYRVKYNVKGNPEVAIFTLHKNRMCDKDYVTKLNTDAKESKEEYLLFLSNAIDTIGSDEMQELLANCQRKEVGVVGAKLYDSNNKIQHAGVILGIGGIAGQVFNGLHRDYSGYMHKASLQQNLSAVTADCMMIKRDVFEEVGGFTEGLATFYDVDFCLKVREKGYWVVFHPYVELCQQENSEKEGEKTAEKNYSYAREVSYMQTRWADILQAGDPMYNPNLTLEKCDYSIKEINRE